MTKSRHIITPKHRWSADDDETLRLNFPMWPSFLIAYLIGCTVGAVLNRAQALGLKKSTAFYTNALAHLWNGTESEGSKAARIKPGQIPPNKGLRRPGYAPGRMAETQFKKGALSGMAAKKLVPVGTESVGADGYLKRKVRDDAHPNQSRLNWKYVHVLVWEEHHGAVPRGHAVAFRNYDKTDIRIGNLELVSRADLMRRNSYHNRYPKEIGLAIQLRGQLNRKINRLERGHNSTAETNGRDQREDEREKQD